MDQSLKHTEYICGEYGSAQHVTSVLVRGRADEVGQSNKEVVSKGHGQRRRVRGA
jgi:hypothetical protein